MEVPVINRPQISRSQIDDAGGMDTMSIEIEEKAWVSLLSQADDRGRC